MSKVSKRELLTRMERLETSHANGQTEIHGMRRELESVVTTLARVETKLELMTTARRDEALNHSNRWTELVKTGTSVITAVGLIIGGIIWIIRATTDMTQVHQTQEKPQIVYVAPSTSAPPPKLTP